MPGQRRDRRIFKKLIRFLDKGKSSPTFPGDLVLKIGEFFIGAPYLAGTLEAGGLSVWLSILGSSIVLLSLKTWSP